MRTNSYIQWYNENEGRSYPIRETATLLSNSGEKLPDDIVVDIGIMVPVAYQDVYFSSIHITDALVTVGISSAASGLMVGTYLRSDTRPHTAYPLTAVVDDVSGWVVFGTHIASGVEDYRFSGCTQSGIETRAIKVVDALPVKKLMKSSGRSDQYVDGVIKLIAGPGITIRQDPVNTQRILVGLSDSMRYSILGPCNQTASTKQCGVPPIRSISGVCPDKDGRITLRFE